MPELGDVKRGREIDKNSPSDKFMWVECPGCGHQRWSKLHYSVDRSGWDPSKFPCSYCARSFQDAGLYTKYDGFKEAVVKGSS